MVSYLKFHIFRENGLVRPRRSFEAAILISVRLLGTFRISLIMKSLRGAILFEKKRKPINVQKRPGVALEPSPACPPLKRYLLRPSGWHVLEDQVSHMSKKFNSSFASKEMSLNAS